MEWKKDNFLFVEGEGMRPGCYDNRNYNDNGTSTKNVSNITPEFLKNVFNNSPSTIPVAMTHNGSENIGFVTVGYDESTNSIHYKGVVAGEDNEHRVLTQGFDNISFELYTGEDDNDKTTPLDGIIKRAVFTRLPAIPGTNASKSWIAFSSEDENVTEIETTEVKVETKETKPEKIVEKIVVQKEPQLIIPSDIIKPKLVRLKDGGYVLMNEDMLKQETNKVEVVEQKNVSNEDSPEKLAQIELARKVLEDKQRFDKETLDRLTSENLEMSETLDKLRENEEKYRTLYESTLQNEIKQLENELAGLGLNKPEEYLSDLPVETRLKVLKETKARMVKTKSATSTKDIKITEESGKRTRNMEDVLRERGIPKEYSQFLKSNNIDDYLRSNLK